MKTWEQVERRLERLHLPYRVQDETLLSLDGRTVAVTVQGARDRFASPGHPDSKRQARCKQRSLTRYGARMFKTKETVYTFMLEREERLIRAGFVASRLQGFGWTRVSGVTDAA